MSRVRVELSRGDNGRFVVAFEGIDDTEGGARARRPRATLVGATGMLLAVGAMFKAAAAARRVASRAEDGVLFRLELDGELS